MAVVTKADIAARDARLDALKTAVDDFAKSETKRIENETKFLRTVLAGRGSDAVAVTNLLAGAEPLELEIARYIEAGS